MNLPAGAAQPSSFPGLLIVACDLSFAAALPLGGRPRGTCGLGTGKATVALRVFAGSARLEAVVALREFEMVAAQRPFDFFGATMIYLESLNFIDQPFDLSPLCPVRTDDRHWSKMVNGRWDEKTFDAANAQLMATSASTDQQLLVLKLEDTGRMNSLWEWNIYSDGAHAVRRSCQELRKIVDCIRRHRPNLRIGWYGDALKSYWIPVDGTPTARRLWKSANAFLMIQMRDVLDFTCPSLYTFYDDLEGWKKAATANIDLARRWELPCYPYLFMEYHESNSELKGQLLPDATFAAQVELCNNLADGLVVWGGQGRVWNESAGWYQILKQHAAVNDWL